ncbi:hypothetical protein H2203_003539 [Taxawa tesnikishii (nom. ined.)]|nr:hypothetical protein H2203_003539 [Dothideales sp. JES 119]
MAEEPQPSNVHEGAGGPEATPANAEDRKAAAAMDSLDTRGEDEGKRDVNTEALGQAMKNISGAGEKKVEEKRAVKVDPADVNLLVDQLDLSKAKATELLKAHDANAVKAMTAWVTASA